MYHENRRGRMLESVVSGSVYLDASAFFRVSLESSMVEAAALAKAIAGTGFAKKSMVKACFRAALLPPPPPLLRLPTAAAEMQDACDQRVRTHAHLGKHSPVLGALNFQCAGPAW